MNRVATGTVLRVLTVACLLGSVATGTASAASIFEWANTTITVPFNSEEGGDVGPASEFPLTVTVSGLTGIVADVDIMVNGIFHSYSDDLELLVVAPNGQAVVLMSDYGGSGVWASDTIYFDEDTATGLPQVGVDQYAVTPDNPCQMILLCSSAGYSLDLFDGIDPNGTWSFYAYDDEDHPNQKDSGNINGGFAVLIDTERGDFPNDDPRLPPVRAPTPSTSLLMALGMAALAFRVRYRHSEKG